jgi:hypothetical protein
MPYPGRHVPATGTHIRATKLCGDRASHAARPSKMIALWNNFRELGAKLGVPSPEEPLYLLKAQTSFSAIQAQRSGDPLLMQVESLTKESSGLLLAEGARKSAPTKPTRSYSDTLA